MNKKSMQKSDRWAPYAVQKKVFAQDTWLYIVSFLLYGSHLAFYADNQLLSRLVHVNRQFHQNVRASLGSFAIQILLNPSSRDFDQQLFKHLTGPFQVLRHARLCILSPRTLDWSRTLTIATHLQSLALTGEEMAHEPGRFPLTSLTNLKALSFHSRGHVPPLPLGLQHLTILVSQRTTYRFYCDYPSQTYLFCPKLESLSIFASCFSIESNLFALACSLRALNLVTGSIPMSTLFHDCAGMTRLQTLRLTSMNSKPSILSAYTTAQNIHLSQSGPGGAYAPFAKAETGMFRNLTQLHFPDLQMTQEWTEATCKALSGLVELDMMCLGAVTKYNNCYNNCCSDECMLSLSTYYRSKENVRWCFPVIRSDCAHHFASLQRLTFRFLCCISNPCHKVIQTSFARLPALRELSFIPEYEFPNPQGHPLPHHDDKQKPFVFSSTTNLSAYALCNECQSKA